MANLTVSLDNDVLQRAQLRAAKQDTSVKGLVQAYLETYASSRSQHREPLERILEIARTTGARSGGRTWNRDELYER